MFYDPKKPVRKHRWGLPHWHQDGVFTFITWRLADSLPKEVVAKILRQRTTWLTRHPQPWDQQTAIDYQQKFILPLEEKLDDCHGSCCLQAKENHHLVSEALRHFDGQRYELNAYVVMPNHVHVLLQLHPEHPLEKVVKSLKTFTAREINKRLGTNGKLWQARYWDRLIRSEQHFQWTKDYIANNPKKLPPGTYTHWAQ